MPWGELDWSAVGAGAVFLLLMIAQGIRGVIQGKREEPRPFQASGVVVDAARLDLVIQELGAIQGVFKGVAHEHQRLISQHCHHITESTKAMERLVESNRQLHAAIQRQIDTDIMSRRN